MCTLGPRTSAPCRLVDLHEFPYRRRRDCRCCRMGHACQRPHLTSSDHQATRGSVFTFRRHLRALRHVHSFRSGPLFASAVLRLAHFSCADAGGSDSWAQSVILINGRRWGFAVVPLILPALAQGRTPSRILNRWLCPIGRPASIGLLGMSLALLGLILLNSLSYPLRKRRSPQQPMS